MNILRQQAVRPVLHGRHHSRRAERSETQHREDVLYRLDSIPAIAGLAGVGEVVWGDSHLCPKVGPV